MVVIVADSETPRRPVDGPVVCVHKVRERAQDEISAVAVVARLLIRLESNKKFNLVVGQALEFIEAMVQLKYHGREKQIGYVVRTRSHGSLLYPSTLPHQCRPWLWPNVGPLVT